ncbi:MAG: T9SS type A sorting domain-containing protein [Kordia sp.]|uniref:T9SS type A sorting domain-containing protein n=1 Tax=Kordia sp. TaxID=1965332 RepID=UPI00385924A0
MKNTLYFIATVSLYFLATYNCQAQFNPVEYDLYIQNDVYADNFDTAATTGNIIAVNTIFSGGIGNYYATGTTLKDGFTVENGGILFLSVPITGKRASKTTPQMFTADDKEFQLYPNPAVKSVNISLTDNVWNSNVSVEVYAINSSAMLYSKRIQQKDASRISIDISSFPKGIYVVKVYEDKGGKSFTRKLIKN